MARKQLNNCYVNISSEDIEFVSQVLKDDTISGKSVYVAEFEKSLENFFGVRHAVTCTNGTSAIQMALFVLGVEAGDEVILPPTAPVMSVLPIMSLGARPVFVDLHNEVNFDLSIEDIAAKLTPRTRVLINVPMWGYSNNSTELFDFCRSNNIFLLEDLSHNHGVKLDNGLLSGNVGHISIFSTHERKMIATGEGGFILTNNSDFQESLIQLRSFGTGGGDYGVHYGLNYRMSGINAALGITQLRKIGEKITQRTKNAKMILSGLEVLDESHEVLCCGTPNYYALAMLYKGDKKRLENYLYDHGIVSDTYAYKYKPLYKMPLFSDFGGDCPNAEKLIESIITLPTHEGLSKEDVEYIIRTFNSFD
jgi:perosamine synthetase